MYLSPDQIASTHHQTLEAARHASHTLLDAAEQITALGFRFGRAGIANRAAAIDGHPVEAPARWMGTHQSLTAEACEELMRILVAGNKAMIEVGQAQLRAIDQTLMTGVERDESNAPQELSFAFGLLKRGIWRTEEALAGLGSAVVTTTGAVEEQVEQVLDAVQGSAKTTPRRRQKAA